jgi:hypothetical protein
MVSGPTPHHSYYIFGRGQRRGCDRLLTLPCRLAIEFKQQFSNFRHCASIYSPAYTQLLNLPEDTLKGFCNVIMPLNVILFARLDCGHDAPLEQ